MKTSASVVIHYTCLSTISVFAVSQHPTAKSNKVKKGNGRLPQVVALPHTESSGDEA